MAPQTAPMLGGRRPHQRYPGVLANDNVSFRMYPGRIHGLLGENGSGKSTIIKTLSGVQQPDSGEIRLNGRPVRFSGPVGARDAGISTVFQEFSIVPTLRRRREHLHRPPAADPARPCRWPTMRRQAAEILARLGVDLDPDTIVSSLSARPPADGRDRQGGRRRRKPAHPRRADCRPRAGRDRPLPRDCSGGCATRRAAALLYVSHRLDEVVSIVDDVTIMRGAASRARRVPPTLSVDAIVAAMIGATSRIITPRKTTPPIASCSRREGFQRRMPSAMSIGLHARRSARPWRCAGLGFRTEIARALFGVDPLTAGTLTSRAGPSASPRPLQPSPPASA